MVDLSGWHFNDWTVLSIDTNRDGKYYLCQCVCGRVRSVSMKSLLSGVSKCCGGCLNHKRWIARVSHLIGTYVGEWHVLGIDKSYFGGHQGGKFICQCSCGNVCSVAYRDLMRGESRRCRECGKKYAIELHHKRRNDLTGKVFGHWHVLRLDDTVIRDNRGNPIL